MAQAQQSPSHPAPSATNGQPPSNPPQYRPSSSNPPQFAPPSSSNPPHFPPAPSSSNPPQFPHPSSSNPPQFPPSSSSNLPPFPPSSSNLPPFPPSSSSNPPPFPPFDITPLSWEGDRMFNVYIHDYFVKRGFPNAAKELAKEAALGNDITPPINAPQGFMFEWWTVFWVFFVGKTTGNAPDPALLYLTFVQKPPDERQRLMQLAMPSLDPESVLRGAMPRVVLPNGVRPPMMNGPITIPQAAVAGPSTQLIQYPMGASHGPAPPSHQQATAGPSQPAPQMNGAVNPSTPHGHPISNSQRPSSEQSSTRPGPHTSLPQMSQGHPAPSHPSAVPHLQSSQRQVSRGQHDAIRAPGQFHSPSIATSHAPGPSLGPQGPLSHPHISGLGPMPPMAGPSGASHLTHQHLGRGPPPHGGPPNTTSPRHPSQTPTQPYQQLMNPGGAMGHPANGSRSGTPGGNPLTHPSPALASREPPPHGPGPSQSMTEEMSRRYHQQQQHLHQQRHQHHQAQVQAQHHQQQAQQRSASQEPSEMETNLGRIPKVFLHPMLAEAGCNDGREVEALSFEEKTRLNEVFKKTMTVYTGGATGSTPTVPPRNASVSRTGMSQAPPMAGMPMGPPQGPSRRPSTAHRGTKRSSTSGEDEGGSTPKDHSPPERERERERKRPRHSPPGSGPSGTPPSSAPPHMLSMGGGFPPNHPANRPGGYPGPLTPQHLQSLPNGFRGGPMGPPMNPHTGQPVPNLGGMGMTGMVPGMIHSMPNLGQPGMGHMTPALTNQHIHQMPNSQVSSTSRPPLASPEMSYPFQNQSQQMQQQMHYRQAMANPHLHKMPNTSNSANRNSSPSTDPHDNNARVVAAGSSSGSGNRSQQGKPGSMMPPPSPAHRAGSANIQKGTGMMPPPAQPASASGNPGVSKEQPAPSPAGGRHEGATGSSPSGARPASRSGAGVSVNISGPSSMTRGSGGGPSTPASAGGTNNNGNNNASSSNTTAPSPASVLANRISPSAAMNSLSRPQTSGPDSNVSTIGNASGGPPPPSAPPSANDGLPSGLFSDFFDSMEDNFGLDPMDTTFSQWIDMNPVP